MKRNLIIVLATILLTACGAKDSSTSSANSGANSPSAKPAVGDMVVAKHKMGSFAEGKIQSIEGEKANIAWSSKDLAAMDIDLANVYPIPKAGDPINVKAGDFALANTSSYHDGYWNKVQVTNVSGATITIKETNADSHDISSDKVIAVSPTESADIKSMFDKNSKKADFDADARKTRPVVLADYKPKVGETVVAEAPLAWNTGKVKSISGDKATILWDPQNNSTFETTLDKIVPYPTAASATMPAVNDYVLIKMGDPRIWQYAQVTSVNGTNAVVKDKYGETNTVKPGEFILLK